MNIPSVRQTGLIPDQSTSKLHHPSREEQHREGSRRHLSRCCLFGIKLFPGLLSRPIESGSSGLRFAARLQDLRWKMIFSYTLHLQHHPAWEFSVTFSQWICQGRWPWADNQSCCGAPVCYHCWERSPLKVFKRLKTPAAGAGGGGRQGERCEQSID